MKNKDVDANDEELAAKYEELEALKLQLEAITKERDMQRDYAVMVDYEPRELKEKNTD